MKIARYQLVVMVMAFALTACSEIPNKIGATVKGERIAVMANTKTASEEKELQGEKPQLSEVVNNPGWPQAGYDATHVMPHANASGAPQRLWSSSIGAGSNSDVKLLARPVVANSRIYTMDAEGVVSGFDATDGSRMWEFDTAPEDSDHSAIGGGLAINSNVVFAATGFGEVIALNAGDGKVKWRKQLQNPLRAAPTVADGKVYAVSIINELQALDEQTGEVLWHHNGIAESATLMGASNPAVVGDSVVVAYSSGEIYNLRSENGRVSWNYGLTTPTQVGALPAIADIRGLPVIDRGRVFAISHSGRMAAIDQRSGDRAWEADIGGINTPVVSGDTIFVLSNDDRLIAIARDSGRILWSRELQRLSDPEDRDSDPVFWTGPALANGRLWLTNSLGTLASYSAEDGREMEKIDLDEPSFITPVIANNIFYIVTDNGKLIALR